MTRDRRFWNVLPNNWELGSVVTTDPGDQPLSPDQSAFPVCWPRGLGGGPGPRMNLSPMCSACPPVGKSEKDSSRVWHWSVVWVNPPHEKHPATDSHDGSGEATSSSVIVPTGSQFNNNVSKSVAGDLCHRRWWAYHFHQLLDEEVPVRTYRNRLQRRWCRRRQQLLNDVFDGLRLRRYGRCQFNLCYLTKHTHRAPVHAHPWLNCHFTVSFPHPTTFNYVGHGSI